MCPFYGGMENLKEVVIQRVVTRTVKVQLSYHVPTALEHYLFELRAYKGLGYTLETMAKIKELLGKLHHRAMLEINHNSFLPLWLNHHPGNQVDGQPFLTFYLDNAGKLHMLYPTASS